MKKIGISLATLLALATAACAESPTAGVGAPRTGGFIGSGHYEAVSPGLAGSGHEEQNPGPGLAGHPGDAEGGDRAGSMTEAQANPGFLGSGH